MLPKKGPPEQERTAKGFNVLFDLRYDGKKGASIPLLRNMIPSATSVCLKFALRSIALASSIWVVGSAAVARTDAGAVRCGLLEKGKEQLAHGGRSRDPPKNENGVRLEIGSNNGKKYCGIMMPIITTRLQNGGKKGFTTVQ